MLRQTTSLQKYLKAWIDVELELRERQKAEAERLAKETADYSTYLPLVSPPGFGELPRHLSVLAHQLDRVTRGEIDRLAIFMPPRHGKTETVTLRYPLYRLEKDPETRILVTAATDKLARKFSRRTRNMALTRIDLSKDRKAAEEWETARGGGVVARGVKAPPIGQGYHLIVIDDPIRKRKDAESINMRDDAWDWYTDDIYTRLEPGGAIIMILTRWHHDDLAARAIASEPDKWTVVRMPALAEGNDSLGRKEGEPLWPERYDRKALLRIKSVQAKKDGAYSFESLYQQNPTPRDGDFFKVTKFGEPLRAIPAALRLCRGWDLAATSGGGDYTAGVLLGIDDAKGYCYVLDVKRERYSSDERNEMIKQTSALDAQLARKHGGEYSVQLAIDPGQAGVEQGERMIRMLSGYSVQAKHVSGKKTTRADPFSSQVNVGNVKLLQGAWNSTFIDELRQFDRGAFDDQVDAAADAYNRLESGGMGISV